MGSLTLDNWLITFGGRAYEIEDFRGFGYYTAILLGLVLATPLLLGPWWAFIPAILAILCLIFRTFLEDRTLRKELSGYEAYTRKVRYRLLPGLW